MKRTITLVAVLCLLQTLAFGQKKYEMVIEKTDGTETVINVEDIVRTYFRERTDESGEAEGHAPAGVVAVDLGLPSGTKWANMNVGAEKPEDYGDYLAWGETKPKDVYDWSTYIHCDGSRDTCHDLGSDIAGEKDYDAATANWGAPWRMPSLAQCQELINNTTSEWTSQNGVNGRKFTGPNGGTIFLPAAGSRWISDLDNAGTYGFYWSSTLYESSPDRAYRLDFYSGSADWYGIGSRYGGFTVRPVYSELSAPAGAVAVDLGLPSGTKWANMNVGAEKPEDYGDYFAWGETKPKDVYDWSTYIHCDGSEETCHDLGSDISGKKDYDAATANWGLPWKMPTDEQCKELEDNCTSEWTQENGIYGRKFTGPNGATIFLPAAGYRWDSNLDNADSYGGYWSSTLTESDPGRAWDLIFRSGGVLTNYYYRSSGLSVRPVR